jgi:hypothetical protein
MLILNTPSKTQDFETKWASVTTSSPVFQEEAAELVSYVRKLTKKELGTVLEASEALADFNYQRYKSWKKTPAASKQKPALLAYVGQIYQKMQPGMYTKEQQLYAQSSARILSGLYGVLRAYDLIQPYRLEMKARLATDSTKNLYQFWKEKVTHQLKKDLEKDSFPVVIDLASKEYSDVVDFEQLQVPYYRIEFRQKKGSVSSIKTLYAKQARGLMLEYLIRCRAQSLDVVLGFHSDGYQVIAQKQHVIVFEKML